MGAYIAPKRVAPYAPPKRRAEVREEYAESLNFNSDSSQKTPRPKVRSFRPTSADLKVGATLSAPKGLLTRRGHGRRHGSSGGP
jgi:hypothetical protein